MLYKEKKGGGQARNKIIVVILDPADPVLSRQPQWTNLTQCRPILTRRRMISPAPCDPDPRKGKQGETGRHLVTLVHWGRLDGTGSSSLAGVRDLHVFVMSSPTVTAAEPESTLVERRFMLEFSVSKSNLRCMPSPIPTT